MAVELATLSALCTGVRAFCAAAGFFGREAVVGLSGGFVSIVGCCRILSGLCTGLLVGCESKQVRLLFGILEG